MSRLRPTVLVVLLPALLTTGCHRSSVDAGKPLVRVGSKAMPENVLLGEMVAHLARVGGARVEEEGWLGDTSKAWNALLDGGIDVYCEYTGTLRQEVLSGEPPAGRRGPGGGAGEARPAHEPAARFQQQLCHRHAAAGGRGQGHSYHFGPQKPQ